MPTDTRVNDLVINVLSQEQYNNITPSNTELYLVPEIIDASPTQGSTNPITSGGVYTALQNISTMQGTRGLQGIQGTKSTQGATGLQGNYGFQGYQGLQGYRGLQGTSGSQGTTGTGLQGYRGLQGTLGSQGVQGIQGLDGRDAIGEQGIQGIQGIHGIQGIQGRTTIPRNNNIVLITTAVDANIFNVALLDGDIPVREGDEVTVIFNHGFDNYSTDSTHVQMMFLYDEGCVGIFADKLCIPVMYRYIYDSMTSKTGALMAPVIGVDPITCERYAIGGRHTVSFSPGAEANSLETHKFRYTRAEISSEKNSYVYGLGVKYNNIYYGGTTEVESHGLLELCAYYLDNTHLYGEYVATTISKGDPCDCLVKIGHFDTIHRQTAIQGVQGIQGFQGIQGLQGYYGIQGLQGTTGSQGTTGTGLQGYKGLQGTLGNQGIQGPSGSGGGSSLPSVTTSDNGKVLTVVSGAWAASMPVTIYSGSSAPSSAIGSDGDIYIQTT